VGPQIVYFGLATTDGCVYCANPGCDCSGWPTRTPNIPGPTPQIFSGDGGTFRIVVEARPGTSRTPLATPNFKQYVCPAGSVVPNLQIESTRNMGNANNPVCSSGGGYNVNGGIAGIDPPNFAPEPAIITALRSFAVGFVYTKSTGDACTFVNGGGGYSFVSPIATAQFCDPMSLPQAFPPGDSLLTVQLTDAGGNVGPTAQIIVRVSTWTPTLTVTPTRPTATRTATQPTATPTATQPTPGFIFAPRIAAPPAAVTRTATRTSAATPSPKVSPTFTATATPTAT